MANSEGIQEIDDETAGHEHNFEVELSPEKDHRASEYITGLISDADLHSLSPNGEEKTSPNQMALDLEGMEVDGGIKEQGVLLPQHKINEAPNFKKSQEVDLDKTPLDGNADLRCKTFRYSELQGCAFSEQNKMKFDQGLFKTNLYRCPNTQAYKNEPRLSPERMSNKNSDFHLKDTPVCDVKQSNSETVERDPRCSDSNDCISSLDPVSNMSGQRVEDDATDTGFCSIGTDSNTRLSSTTPEKQQHYGKLTKLCNSRLEVIEYVGSNEESLCDKKTCEMGVQCGEASSDDDIFLGDSERNSFISKIITELHWEENDHKVYATRSDSFLYCDNNLNMQFLETASHPINCTRKTSKCDAVVKDKKQTFHQSANNVKIAPIEGEYVNSQRNRQKTQEELQHRLINKTQSEDSYLVDDADEDEDENDDGVASVEDDPVDNDCPYNVFDEKEAGDGECDDYHNFMYCVLKNAGPTRSITSSISSAESPRRSIFAFSPIFNLFQTALDVTNSCDPSVSDEEDDHHHNADYGGRNARMRNISSSLENGHNNRGIRAPLSFGGSGENGEPASSNTRGGHLMNFIEQLSRGNNDSRGDNVSVSTGVSNPNSHRSKEINPSEHLLNATRRLSTSAFANLPKRARTNDSSPMTKFSNRSLNDVDVGRANKVPIHREIGKPAKTDASKFINPPDMGNNSISPIKFNFSNNREFARLSKTEDPNPITVALESDHAGKKLNSSPNKTENNIGEKDGLGVPGVIDRGENNNMTFDNLAAASAFIGEYLYELWKNECLCDVRIRVGSKSFLAHKIVLAAFSDVFCPSEPMPNPTLMVDVPNTTSGAVFQILQYLYTSEMNITDETIEDILSAAMFLGVTDVVDLIKNILTHPSKDNINLYMDIIDRMQIPVTTAENAHLFREFLQDIWDFNVFKNLPERDIRAILSDQLIKVDGETDLIVAMVKWVEHDMENRQHLTPSLLKHINFVRISPDALAVTTNENDHIFHNTECQAILAEVYKSFAIVETAQNPYARDSAIDVHDPEFHEGEGGRVSRMSRKASMGPDNRHYSAAARLSAAAARPGSMARQSAAGSFSGSVIASPAGRQSSVAGLRHSALARQSAAMNRRSGVGVSGVGVGGGSTSPMCSCAGAGGCTSCCPRLSPACLKCGVACCSCPITIPIPKACQDLKAAGLLRSSCVLCGPVCSCQNPPPPPTVTTTSTRTSRASMASPSFNDSPKSFRHKDSIFVSRHSHKPSASPDTNATLLAINDQFRRASRTSRATEASPTRIGSRIVDLHDTGPQSISRVSVSSAHSRKQFRIAEQMNTEHRVSFIPKKSTTPPRSSRQSEAFRVNAVARASFVAETQDILDRQSIANAVARESTRPQSVSPRESTRKSNRMSTRASSVPRGSKRMSSIYRVSTREPSRGQSPPVIDRQSMRQSFTTSNASPAAPRQSMRASAYESPGPARQSMRASAYESPGPARQSTRMSGRMSAVGAAGRASNGARQSLNFSNVEPSDTLDDTITCEGGACALNGFTDEDDQRVSRSSIPSALRNSSVAM